MISFLQIKSNNCPPAKSALIPVPGHEDKSTQTMEVLVVTNNLSKPLSKTLARRIVRGNPQKGYNENGHAGNYVPHKYVRHKIQPIDINNFNHLERATVEDISLQMFYRPHTLGMLFSLTACLIYFAFTLDDCNQADNTWTGIKVMFIVFLIISALAFPNGPFIRPHPLVWQMVFGMSVMYLLFLQFFLFQNFQDVKLVLKWFDPQNLNKDKLDEKIYAVDCNNVTLERIYDSFDIFALAHFLGWVMKSMLIRHTLISWYISIAWELTEMAFTHLLPNFQECWWDAIILDIIMCNGLGIYVGTRLSTLLEMRQFKWESIKNIPGARGKIKRAVLQFTPASWTHVHWMDSQSSMFRVLGIWEFVLLCQISELNTFFIKHIFAIDSSHPLVLCRLLLVGLMAAPSIRQWYNYITDPKCYRMGTQCWIFCAIVFTEATICFKFGTEIFAQAQMRYILSWLTVLFCGSILCVYISVQYADYSGETDTPIYNKNDIRENYFHEKPEYEFESNHSHPSEGGKEFLGVRQGFIRTPRRF